MNWIARTFSFWRINKDQLREKIEQALHSLHARGTVDSFHADGANALLVQWGRGNFGLRLEIRRERSGWTLAATPIANPAGPFTNGGLSGEIQPLPYWTACGAAVEMQRLERTAHLQLIDWIRELESRHPATEWLGVQFRRLAEGEQPDNEDLQGVVLLGVRRFLKTIPSSDRLHETIGPALLTLLRIRARGAQPANAEEALFAGEDYAAALIEFLQETHPLEAKRAAHRYMMAPAD